MTLTALLPTLRRSIPDPIALDQWPELTHATTSDVLVAGVSLLRVVDVCGTPCTHSAAAVAPGSNGWPSPTLRATAAVMRIVAITRTPTGVLRLEVDARVDRVDAVLAETRLIGRASTAKAAAAMLVDGARAWPLVHGLPGDVAVGDLLAFPCRGSVAATQLVHGAGGAAPAAGIESWLHSLA
jgi:hypothetical protein